MKKEKKKINWKLVMKLTRGYNWQLIAAGIFLIIAVAAAYITPMIVSFTVDYVLDDKEGPFPTFVMDVIESWGGREYLSGNIWICAAAFVGFTAINGIATYFRRHYVALSSEGIAMQTRNMLYEHLQKAPYDYHKHVSTGDLIQRCTSDIETVRRFIANQLLEIARTLLMVAVAAYVMFSLDPVMALISVTILPFMCLASFLYFSKVKSQFTMSDEAEGKLSAALQENLTGVRVVRAFGQQKNEMDRFTRLNAEYRDKTYKLIKYMGIYWGTSDFAGYTQIAVTLFAGVMFCLKGRLTLGDVMIFTSYAGMLTWPVRQLGRVLADLGKAIVSLDRIDEIMNVEPETEPGAALRPEIRGRIEFRDVCFGYDEYNDVLDGVSFTAEPGQTIAILGSTGSGKTSLVQLLQRLYTCTAGEILVDGVNINDIEHSHLRSNIGIVLQEPFLYSKTIMENISIVKPEAGAEAVYDAARTASVHNVICSFANGYDTVVGERGVTLSGGQKQRVAIARMLMQNAPIIIFDDSMSAVDTETDAAIREALKARKMNTTTFIISHRITTLCEADNILVLEHGRLVQQGTHDELVRQEGLYRRIAHIQNALEEDLEREIGNKGGEAK